MNKMLRPMLREYIRPWKLATFGIGIGFLIIGAIRDWAPDWDVPISLMMGSLTYLTAPWCMRVLLERQWRNWPLMVFLAWFTVDGCYAVYWHFRNPVVLSLMREANFITSLPLFGISGIVWLYRGTLRQLWGEVTSGAGSLRRKGR